MFKQFVKSILAEHGYSLHNYISPSFYMASKGNQKLMLFHFVDMSTVVINGDKFVLSDPEFKQKLIDQLDYTEETLNMGLI